MMFFVNETPTFQCLEPTDLSHIISVRGDSMDDALMIPLDLKSFVPCFSKFKPTQHGFDICDRYEFTYESSEYDRSAKSFSEQEAVMTDSRWHLKVSGDSHPRWHQVCTPPHKELEGNTLSMSYSETSATLQDLSIILDDNTLLP
jgi:hypothetical protein